MTQAQINNYLAGLKATLERGFSVKFVMEAGQMRHKCVDLNEVQKKAIMEELENPIYFGMAQEREEPLVYHSKANLD